MFNNINFLQNFDAVLICKPTITTSVKTQGL